MKAIQSERQTAIHLLRAGKRVSEVAQQMKRSETWVRKWQHRYREQGWSGLRGETTAPKAHGRRLCAELETAIIQTRSELEAEAALGTGLKYIGGRAIRTRFKQSGRAEIPSQRAIERVLRRAGLARAYQKEGVAKIDYPHLHPQRPHVLCQVDIAPHFLTGGQRVACFNALDVVSRYPTGYASAERRSQEAAAFLIRVWQEIGIAQYTQVDNEACFSGGFSHPYVLGKVARLALFVGTELLFSPVRYPESNGYVERFHQDYDLHVWQNTYLEALSNVRQQEQHFFQLYRTQHRPQALAGKTPAEAHTQPIPNRLADDFVLPTGKLPLTEGRIHFIRKVQPAGTVSVLNVDWSLPKPTTLQAVWVTLDLRPKEATLLIYDQAPDRTSRTALVTHPFPLAEPVLAANTKGVQPIPTAPLPPTAQTALPFWFLPFSLPFQFARTFFNTIY